MMISDAILDNLFQDGAEARRACLEFLNKLEPVTLQLLIVD